MNISDFDRLRLVGDEDCGVTMECKDCNNGQPLAWLRPDPEYYPAFYDDYYIPTVDSINELLTYGLSHLDKHHKSSEEEQVNKILSSVTD